MRDTLKLPPKRLCPFGNPVPDGRGTVENAPPDGATSLQDSPNTPPAGDTGRLIREESRGGELVAEAEERLSRLGIDLFDCLIEADNEASMRFFEKMGYTRGDVAYYSKRPYPGA